MLKLSAATGAALAAMYVAPAFRTIRPPTVYAATLTVKVCPLCASLGKPQLLTMEYTGGSVEAHSQAAGKVIISGTPPALPTRIIASSKADWTDSHAKIWFDGVPDGNGLFAINSLNHVGSKVKHNLGAKTFVLIFVGSTVVQTIEFHTSCSQPLFIGDQFGSIKLVHFMDKDGLTEANAECESGSGDGNVCAGAKTGKLLMKYTGEDEFATSNSQDSGKTSVVDAPDFTAFTSQVHIHASDGGSVVWFDGTVTLNSSFEIDSANGVPSTTKLKANTWVTISTLDGTLLQTLQIHTSCSQPLIIGDQWGGLVLEVFTAEGA